jgi:hypothetical protein
MYAACAPAVQARFDAAALQPWHDAINTGDSLMDDLVVRNGGYYETLTKADPGNAQLWEALTLQRMPYAYQGADPIRPVNDFRFRELLPNLQLKAYDTEFETNEWGMRDRDYELVRPAGTFRIAVLGSSHTMGWGVSSDEVFESLLERRLNPEHPEGPEQVRFEVLNFAANGLSPLGQVSALEQRIVAFRPDLVLLVTHPIDYDWVGRDLPRSLRQRVPIGSAFLESVLREARVTARTHEAIASRRLHSFEPALLEWSYRAIAERIRGLGAVGVGAFVPLPGDLPLDADATARQMSLIAGSGLIPVDLSRVYEGIDARDVRQDEPWGHTNPRGHALIADALYERLIADPAIDLRARARAIRPEQPVDILANTR